MLASGAKVVICGRRKDVLENTCRQLGKNAMYIVYDVTRTEQTADLVEHVKKQAGLPQILVNCAGNQVKKTLAQTTDKDLMDVLKTHLVGAYALTRAMIPLFTQQGYGSIIFITSMAAIFGVPFISSYAAAKSALLGVVRTLAVETAAQGIRVNAIAPGWIETELSNRSMKGDPDRKNRVLTRTPMGKFGLPEDIGWGAVYLCSPAARFITGHQLIIDGGISIGF
jgi:gluconate 5-dehydrogenase